MKIGRGYQNITPVDWSEKESRICQAAIDLTMFISISFSSRFLGY